MKDPVSQGGNDSELDFDFRHDKEPHKVYFPFPLSK